MGQRIAKSVAKDILDNITPSRDEVQMLARAYLRTKERLERFEATERRLQMIPWR